MDNVICIRTGKVTEVRVTRSKPSPYEETVKGVHPTFIFSSTIVTDKLEPIFTINDFRKVLEAMNKRGWLV